MGLVVLISFVLGFALSRASTCTVAATKRLVLHKKPDWLIGIGIAVCWSAATLMALAYVLGMNVPAPTSVPINATLILASVAMGLGAFLNGACFIGSIGHISSGNLSFLMTFVGLVAARIITQTPLIHATFEQPAAPRSLLSHPVAFWVIAAVFAIGFLYGLVRMVQRRKQALVALCVMGLTAALLFSSNPGWSYEAWIGRVIDGQGLSRSLEIEMIILALFSGAVISSALNGSFQLTAPKMKRSTLCFLGGLFMGFGARFAPGGNDTLLLWTIPSFVLYGFVCYATMVMTVGICVHLTRSNP